MSSTAKTVVVAEDEVLVRMLAAEALSDAGFNVIEAVNAEEAICALQAHSGQVAMLFTDIHMPGELTGLELAALVREQWPHVAILVTSGQERPATSEIPSGGRFVAKPYRTAKILAHTRALTEMFKQP